MAENNKNNVPKGPGPKMGGGSEKPKNFKESLGKLIRYSKPFYSLIIMAIIFAMASSIISIIGPNQLSELTNTITNGLLIGIDLDKVKSIFLFLLIMYSLSFILGYLENYIMAIVTNKFSFKLRNEISEKINRLPLKYFDRNSIGDTLSRVTNDVDTIGQAMNNSVSSLISAITLFIGVLVMMIYTNWIMAITAVLATIIGFALMMIIMGRSQKYFDEQQKELGKINGHIEETYSGHKVVKLYNGIHDANNKFDEINEKLFKSGQKSQFMSGLMMPIMGFIGNFGYVAVCIVGAILSINGSVTMGTIVAFMLYVRLFSNPLTTLAQCFQQLQSASAASERVFEFLEEVELNSEAHIKNKLKVENAQGNIEFNNVKFGYDDNNLIIKDFNTKVSAGQKIAIVGPTGAGKTTMVNLLMKFYEISDGDIKIDGISIKELTRENIHDLFIMVLQDTWMFDGTIKENIIYNQKNITDEQVKYICKVVGLDHFIKTLPKGYDTILSDNEIISAGQKQLLTIARGMTKDSPFLILDEATSSVDTRTEELVQKAMDELSKNKTSFIIAHRLSTIKNADLILVIDQGNIVEIGNHEELLEKEGFYAELYNSQFQNT